MACSTASTVRVGLLCGRREQFFNAAVPSLTKRAIRLLPIGRLIPKRVHNSLLLAQEGKNSLFLDQSQFSQELPRGVGRGWRRVKLKRKAPLPPHALPPPRPLYAHPSSGRRGTSSPSALFTRRGGASRAGAVWGGLPSVNLSHSGRYLFDETRGPSAVQCLQQATHYGWTQTMTTNTFKALLIAALLSSVSAFADQSIEVSIVNGKQQAAFGVGDSKCVLVDDVIKCTPVVLASN